MAHRIAAIVAALALVLAPLAFSFEVISFLHAKELVYAVALCVMAMLGAGVPRGPLWVRVLGWGLVALAVISLNAPYLILEKLFRSLLAVGFAVAAWRLLPTARLRAGIIASAVLVSAAGLLQYVGATDRWLPVFPSYDQRMYSVFGNQDLLGGYAALALPLLLGVWLKGVGWRTWQGAVAGVAAMVLGTALLLSGSRSAWLAAALGVAVVLFLERKQRRKIAVAALAGLVLLCATATVWVPRVMRTYSAADTGGNLRTWFYAGTWDMIKAHPWLGVGLGGYGYYSPRHMGAVLLAPGGERLARNELFVDHAHSDPLEALAEFGVLGMVLLAAGIMVAWRKGGEGGIISVPERGALVVLGVFACLNPALASMPHAVAGLCCLLSGAARGDDEVKRAWTFSRCAVVCVVAAGWVWLTWLPSAAMVRAENRVDPADACGNAARFSAIAMRFHGPAGAYEAAIFWAAPCAAMSPERLDGALERLIEAGRRMTDTGNFHGALADLYRVQGKAEAAQSERAAMAARWVGL